jgi:hypothetical protein
MSSLQIEDTDDQTKHRPGADALGVHGPEGVPLPGLRHEIPCAGPPRQAQGTKDDGGDRRERCPEGLGLTKPTGTIGLVSGPVQEAVIRRLPEGESQKGILQEVAGRLLRIRVAPDSTAHDFTTGSLVEVACPQMLYLGEVHSWLDEIVTVFVEHSVDRAALAAIRRVWYRPEGG